MRNLHDRASKFVSLYNIPLEENWEEYMKCDYMNYFRYMAGLEITDSSHFDINNQATYKLSVNHKLINFFSKYNSYFDCDHMQDKTVVDVGCGWGFLAFWFLLCGAREVDAIGFPYQIAFIERLKKAGEERKLLPPDGKLRCIAKPMEKGNRDIGGLGFNHADLVTYTDVFEHIPDDIFDDMIIASFNTIKPGGLLISTCHNTDNSKMMAQIINGWDKIEKDVFIEARRNLILKKIPGIAGDHLEKLIVLTRGLMTKEFNEVLDKFNLNGSFPAEHTRIRPAVDLSYDYICENYISPSVIVEKMKKVGFTSYCYPALRHSRRYTPLWPFEKLLNNFMMGFEALSGSVVFVGKKKSK